MPISGNYHIDVSKLPLSFYLHAILNGVIRSEIQRQKKKKNSESRRLFCEKKNSGNTDDNGQTEEEGGRGGVLSLAPFPPFSPFLEVGNYHKNRWSFLVLASPPSGKWEILSNQQLNKVISRALD
jgi:hypothetical protein